MPKKALLCPECGSRGFHALEQVQARYYCEINLSDDRRIEITQDSVGEFIRDMASSVVVAYACTMCPFTATPDVLVAVLKEAE